MADASGSSRPRPRPRPRPTAKTQKAASPTPGPSTEGAVAGPSSSATPAPANSRVGIDNDIDAMFIKNRNRTFITWQELDKARKDEPVTNEGSGSDSDENLSPNSRKRSRKKSASLPKPKWQRDKNVLRALSETPKVDSDSDSDLEILEGASTPSRSKRQFKRAKRSRSRSITPPPQLPLQQIENVRRVVMRAMDQQQPSKSPANADGPNDDDDDYMSSDTVTLDPELARIAIRVQREATSTPADGSDYNRATSVSVQPSGEDDDVEVTVKWHHHPLAENIDEDIVWQYKISQGDDFRDLFEAIAEDAKIRSERLVVCFDGKRIFASITPSTLNLWKSADFDAYDKAAFEYIRNHLERSYASGLSSTQPQTQPPSSAQDTIELSDGDDDQPPRPSQLPTYSQPQPSQAPSAHPDADHSEAEDDDKFKLILRSGASKDITLTVRPNTKCGNIVKAFLKKTGLEIKYPHVFEEAAPSGAKPAKGWGRGKAAATPVQKYPKLSVDGDKLDNNSPIGDADLEDGDLVEVVDL